MTTLTLYRPCGPGRCRECGTKTARWGGTTVCLDCPLPVTPVAPKLVVVVPAGDLPPAAQLYHDCLSLSWDQVHAALERLDDLTHSEAKAAYAALRFATRYQSREQAVALIRLKILQRKGTFERSRM